MMFPLTLLLVSLSAPPAEDLTCLQPDSGANTLVYQELQKAAYAALDRRRETVEKLTTAAQIHDYQQRMRTYFATQLGGFPERTPLNAQTVGKLIGDGYRIEKVIFESQPNHHVTANLYVPEGTAPFPAVLVSSGHSRTAKTADYNQRFGIMLARHGIAAFCYDPIGQGERSQILTGDGRPQFSGTTQEHFVVGVGSILVGANTATYRIWDAMRAIDYLETRPEIDAKRIGMTGCSGGGTLTSYVMALDPRIVCAAPACYLTTFRKLIETIGPQDAEQNIFGQLAFGMDQPDYVLMRAPRPTFISATTSDFFDIEGTWDNLRQAKRIYTRLGFPERIDLVEAEGKHGVQPANLAAIVQWLRRWLVGKDEAVAPIALEVRPEADLLCTEKGQVLLLPGERSVFDLNVERAARLAAQRRSFWQTASADKAIQVIRQTAGIRPMSEMPATRWEKAGRVDRDGYHIDKVILRSDSNVPLPALTYHPKDPQDDAYLYIHDGGKAADGAAGGPIESLVKEGYVVVSVDLRGQGETSSGNSDTLLGDWKTFYLAYLLGKPLVGMQAEDLLAAGHFVAHYQAKEPRRVHLVAVGNSGIAALHAASVEPSLFASVVVRRSPRDWESQIGNRAPLGILTTTVHGALAAYDLPDLMRLAKAEVKKEE